MNFIVSSQVPEDHAEYIEIGEFKCYEGLVNLTGGLLNADYRKKLTTGPLKSTFAINLATELSHDKYDAVVGPVALNAGETGASQMQVYFTRKRAS